MKVKVLRYKKEHNKFQEFVHIEDIGAGPEIFTSTLPKVLPETATLEGFRDYIETNDYYEGLELDWDTVELVEFDLVETGEVGADIRNKLGNYSNLVQMVELLLDEKDRKVKKELKKLIRTEIVHGKKSVEYLAKLF